MRICLCLGLALVKERLAWPITIPLPPSNGLTLGIKLSSPGLDIGLITCITGLILRLSS